MSNIKVMEWLEGYDDEGDFFSFNAWSDKTLSIDIEDQTANLNEAQAIELRDFLLKYYPVEK